MNSKAVVTGMLVLVGIVSLLLLIGCGGSTASMVNNQPPPTDPGVSVTLSPRNVSNLPAGATQNFTVIVNGSNNQMG